MEDAASKSLIGELVRTEKNVLGLSIDSNGKRRSIRLKAGCTFLVVDVCNDDQVPTSWRDALLLKIIPLGDNTYDDFALNIKVAVSAIYVELGSVQFLST